MPKIENHLKVYELIFEDNKKLGLKKLIEKIQEAIKKEYLAKTQKGSFYIKEIKKGKYSYTLLFGKDNEDASNYKREKNNLHFEKIDINQDKEILTDFIHICFSNKYDVKEKSKIGCTIFAEKSSLIRVEWFIEYLNFLLDDAMLVSLRRRVIKEYKEAIKNSKRIVKITQSKKDVDLPIPSKDNESLQDDITVEETFTIKSEKRGGSLTYKLFEKVFKNFNKNNGKSKFIVDVISKEGNAIPIDFQKVDAEYSVKYLIPLNQKKDIIQEDIMDKMDWYMHLEQEQKKS